MHRWLRWQLLPDQGYIASEGYDLGIVADHLYHIDVDIRRRNATVESAVPSIRLRIGGKVPPFEDQLSPAIEHAHRLDIIKVAAPGVEYIVNPVSIGRESIGHKIVFVIADCFYENAVG